MTTPKRRCVIYAQYSTDMQNPMSTRDQIALCRRFAERNDWIVIQTYEDAGISGSTHYRPGYQQMGAAIAAGLVDVVLAQGLDRLTRDQVETARLYQKCTFEDVKIHTVSDGEINELHVGISGTMNALALKKIRQDTHRGLAGRIGDGKSAGGKSYGYRVPTVGDGIRVVGTLEIVEPEAEIIRRIFKDYATGMSPRDIAAALNNEGIPSPSADNSDNGRKSSGHWKQNTINGNRLRGTGILNNELYIGRRVWNRLEYRENPETKRRVSRMRPESEWLRHDVPALRIVSQNLWNAVKERQTKQTRDLENATNRASAIRGFRRKKYLLSGLVHCGICGGKLTVAGSGNSKAYYCANAKEKGASVCEGMPGVRLDKIEPFILRGMRNELMRPEAFASFLSNFKAKQRQMERELTSDRDIVAKQIHQTERDIKRLKSLLMRIDERGEASEEFLDDLIAAEKKRKVLSEQRDAITSDLPEIPDNLSDLYRTKIGNLTGTLSDPEIVQQASEELTKLVRCIVIGWDAQAGTHMVEIMGDLAGLLGFSAPGIEKACAMHRPSLTLVAGAGFEPAAFRL